MRRGTFTVFLGVAVKKRLITAGCVLFWLVLWQIGACLLDQELLLVSPVRAVERLVELVPSAGFWRSVGFSAGRILSGFGLGTVCGVTLALLAGKLRVVKLLLSPLISAVKAVPVASITVLALIWVTSRNLSVLISFLITLPVVYSGMLEGLENLDPKLSEMARLFLVPPVRRFTRVYLSQLLPYFRNATRLAIGLSWKSGTAAEIIGIPSGSVGEKLYSAKIYLETADLFAWTIAVILLSWASERVFLLVTDIAVNAVSGRHFRGRTGEFCELPPVSLNAVEITKRYGEQTVLSGFSHEFPAGKTTAVMGISGCGKTTLLGILTGLAAPDSGSVDGAALARFSAVFQEDRLCGNLTAEANIRLVTGNSRSAEEIDKALCAVGLEGCADKPVREFSGGMKRRVALVRALLAEYSVIVLDEPFKGLDETTRARVSSWCREMLTGKTAILVTHDLGDCEALSAAEVIELSAVSDPEQHSQ